MINSRCFAPYSEFRNHRNLPDSFEVHRTLSVEEIVTENTRRSRELAGSRFVLGKSRKPA